MKTLLAYFALMIGIGTSAQTITNCCINPDWVDPMTMCTMDFNPVIGCNGETYSNSCAAQASGVTSWTDQSGLVSSLDWNCETGGSLCISYSGVEIFEAGNWVNPNDACEMGLCTPEGNFVGIAIDCPSWFGAPCADL